MRNIKRGRGVCRSAAGFMAGALVLAAAGLSSFAGEEEPNPEAKVKKPGAGLVFPLVVWARIFPEELTGQGIADWSGEVAALTKSRVYYFKGESPEPTWTAGRGEKWKHSQDLWLSRDGRRVLFQTDTKEKKTVQQMNLTIHLYDGDGVRLWSKKNPMRYQNAMLSPSGRYILLGELMHGDLRCFDDNLNLLWRKNIWFWYVAFDPLEHYLFDGEGGVLYSIDGKKVWSFGAHTRILSVSDDAQYVMTQFYRTAQTFKQMFLMSRVELKKVELRGTGGCVSPDGLFTALVGDDGKLKVYRTRELLENGIENLPPLFETSFLRPWSMNLSRDNRSLFVMGQESKLRWVMMLVDLVAMKVAWKETVSEDLRVAIPTEDNKFVLVKPSPKRLVKYRCY